MVLPISIPNSFYMLPIFFKRIVNQTAEPTTKEAVMSKVHFKAVKVTPTLLNELDDQIVHDPGNACYRLSNNILAICKYGMWKFIRGIYVS